MLNIFLVLLSIFAVSQSSAAPPRTATEVGRLDAKTHRVMPVSRQRINSRLPDGSRVKEVTIERMGGKRYLVLRGGTPTHCQTTRVELVAMSSGRFGIPPGYTSQTCTGDPCSRCGFLEPAGCECKDGKAGHKCNHTITSGSDYKVIMY